MRKLLLGFILLITLAGVSTLTGCKKNNDSNNDKIVGKWNVDKVYFDYFIEGESAKDTIQGNSSDYIQFNANGTTSTNAEDGLSSGTWKIEGTKLLTTEDGDDDSDVDYNILKLTDNELQLQAKEIDGEDYVEIRIFMVK